MAFLRNLVQGLLGRLVFDPEADVQKAVPKERKKNAPKSLPRLRPRALSLPGGDFPLSPPSPFIPLTTENQRLLSRRRQYICNQKQSHLLHKLPFEIRLQIWRYCLASLDIHLVRGNKKLIAIPCLEKEDEPRLPPCQHECWGNSTRAFWGYYGVCPGYYIGSRGCPHLPDPIPLLQSCRMVYSEAIILLYRENSFRINHIDTLINLSHTVLPSRLNLIRTLHVAHSFPLCMYTERADALPPYDASTWEQACRIIANMAGLKELYVHLGGSFIDFEFHDILKVLHQIRHVETFHVFVGIACDPDTVYTVDRPFQFVSHHCDLLPEWECC